MRMNTIIEELDRSSKTIAPEKLQEVIKKIKEHKRIFVYGTGRSGLMFKSICNALDADRIKFLCCRRDNNAICSGG